MIISILVSIDANETKDNKEISSQTINDAVSMLGALLNVRDFFTRIAADVEVHMSFYDKISFTWQTNHVLQS